MASIDELVYFEGRGIAEVTRILYYLADQQFKDTRIKPEEWNEFKPTTPMGKLPLLTTERGKINESNVIARYVAKKFGLCGEDLWEETLHDMIVENVKEAGDIARELVIWKIFGGEEPYHKEDTALQKYKQALQIAERTSKDRNSKYIIGSEIGLAEIWLFTMLELAAPVIPNFMESVTPWARQFCEKFRKDEKVAKYLSERPTPPRGV